jgi:hypothetical protein
MLSITTGTVAALGLALLTAGPAAAQARPLSAPLPAVAGEVLALTQTTHLWVADGQGVAHFASDPAALAAHAVDWGDQREVTRDELGALPRGEPWLSMAMVRIGEAIYLPQAAGPGSAPTLLHVQSPRDLALLGVDGADYARLVLDPAAWQQRYGFDPARLTQDELRLYPAPAFDDDSGSAATAVPAPATTRDENHPD